MPCIAHCEALIATGRDVGLGEVSLRRGEIWAQVAAATLLYHLYTFLNSSQPVSIKCVVTHKGIATTLQHRCRYNEPFCNLTLKPDWALLELLYRTNLLQTTSTDIQYICSSDSVTDQHGRQLSITHRTFKPKLQTSLRCFTYDTQRAHSQRFFHPLLECQLLLANRTVESHYTREIRQAATLPAFFGYLKDKHQWTTDTFHDIQWETFKYAATNFTAPNSHNTLTKLVHGQLATQYRKHLSGGQTWTSPTCPHCRDNIPETFEHILRCNHPVAIQFRAEFPKQLTNYLTSTKLPKEFQQTFALAIDQWLWNIDPLTVTTDLLTKTTDPFIIDVASSQHRIGWHRKRDPESNQTRLD
jgi:hypothetical protein